MTTSLPTDTYYRGYRLSLFRKGTTIQKVHIHAQGDPELIAIVPNLEHAKTTIDSWLRRRLLWSFLF